MHSITVKAGTRLNYQNPSEMGGTPQQVAKRAAGDLSDACAVFARHVEATTRQVRSGFLSRELSQKPDLTPKQLAVLWENSQEARACLVLVRSAKAANTATKRVRELQGDRTT
jgi:hypothetical protein